MNAATRNRDELGRLADHVNAVIGDAPMQARADAAQRRLMDRLDQRGRLSAAEPPAFRWRWAAAAAVLALVAVTVVPFMPGGRDGVAFADVQRHFRTFDTLHAVMTTEVAGQTAMTMDIRVDSTGRTRLDAGEMFSYVIAPGAGVMLQLFHDSRTAMRVPLEGAAAPAGASLAWLEDIREFQGQAHRMTERRTIDGRTVQGFELRAGGQDMVLWATSRGEPVRLVIGAGGETASRTQLDFRFDMPLDESAFSVRVPAGYTLLGETADEG